MLARIGTQGVVLAMSLIERMEGVLERGGKFIEF